MSKGQTCKTPEERNLEAVDEDNAVSLVDNRENRNSCQVVKVQLNHSLSMADDRLMQEGRRESMGITVQYLAEENVRLLLANKQLEDELKRLTVDGESTDEDRDAIYGESTEERLSRLEKHLASERREKWSAIENSERTRVDLVNCERELTASSKTIENLTSELDSKRTQIQDLEETVRKLKEKTSKREEGESSGEGRSERQTEMARFRTDLKEKREARQRALSAISQEMNRLREELEEEKLTRRKLERELELRGKIPEGLSLEGLISDNASLKNEIDILTDNVDKLKEFSTENIRLKFETQRLNEEMDTLNSTLGELKFEYYEEKRKHERTLRRLREMEECGNGDVESRRKWEEERERLFEKYDREKEEINKRTNALREVVAITKQMLIIRESEVKDLKIKLKDIEESVKNSRIMEEDGLKAEYEKQLENIKNLRELYEERVRLMEAEREKLKENLQEKAKTIEDQKEEIENLNTEIDSSRAEIRSERQEKESMERELRLNIAKSKDFENELSLINNMFTQMLLGPYNTGNETDLDKLTELLQENHDLITEMTTREDSSEIASVLPKLLLDLITQVDGVNDRKEDDLQESCDTISEQSEGLLEDNKGAVLPILSYKNATLFKPPAVERDSKDEDAKTPEGVKAHEQISPAVQEIASNLPKVWKVLTELLSHHHSAPEEPTPADEKLCYKNVETPNGPRSVISVSKTFIRLKDLILEKKALQKELGRLKQLNSHLECHLDDQEKRLSQVQCELHKTWGIVGRMRTQHKQLHNHEKILRYELQEKRVMLSELKQELEYCRDKWERARQKNIESETEWKKLRREFAARKSKGYLLSNLNDSGESGFSDEQNESGEDFDADRSSTQSPVDRKLLSEPAEIDPSDPEEPDLAEEIIKQSEKNLKQTEESVEHTKLEECAEVSVPQTISTTPRTQESSQESERARAREARDLRLKRLEEQCKLLVRQVDITKHKSNYLNNRLEELHEQYGNSEESRKPVKTKTTEKPKKSSQVDEEEAGTSTTDCEQRDCEDKNKTERDSKDEEPKKSSPTDKEAGTSTTDCERRDCEDKNETKRSSEDDAGN